MRKTSKLTLTSTASLFFRAGKAEGKRPKTLEFYEDRLKVFARWCEGEGVTALEDWTPAITRAYFVSLIEAGYRQGTQNTSGRAIRTFARWCMAEELMDSDPLRNVKIPAPPKEVLPSLSAQDIAKLLAAAPDARGRAMCLFLVDSGVRISEMCALNGADVDLASGQVLVRSGKGGKTRVCFVSPDTTKALLRYFREEGLPEEGEAFWRSQTSGARLAPSGVRQALRAMARDAGVKGVSPHAFRRTHAILHLRAGVDLHTLSRQMGHSGIVVLKRYLDLTAEDVQAAHQRAAIVSTYISPALAKKGRAEGR